MSLVSMLHCTKCPQGVSICQKDSWWSVSHAVPTIYFEKL